MVSRQTQKVMWAISGLVEDTEHDPDSFYLTNENGKQIFVKEVEQEQMSQGFVIGFGQTGHIGGIKTESFKTVDNHFLWV